MTNEYKKEIEEMNRRIYASKSLLKLKMIGKKKVCLMWTNINKPIKIF